MREECITGQILTTSIAGTQTTISDSVSLAIKFMIYECKRGCHVSDKYGRCPRCGEWMLSHGSKTKDEVMAKVMERQNANAADCGRDQRRLDNSHIRAVKKHFDEAEKRYFHNLKQNAN